jgi:hypothetical protein
MDRDDVLKMLGSRPFSAFRLYLSDGAMYEIRHPEQALVGVTSLGIAIQSAEDEIDQLVHSVSMMHITRMVPI